MAGSPRSEHHEADRLMYAGLLGLVAAGVIQLFEKDNLTPALLVAVYAFASAMPLLTCGLLADYARKAGRVVPPLHTLVGGLGILAAVVGISASFFHFGLGPGAVFVAGAMFCLLLTRRL